MACNKCVECGGKVCVRGASPFAVKNQLCPACWRDFRHLSMYDEDRKAEDVASVKRQAEVQK